MITPQNARYRDALAGSHNAYSRVEVWRAGVKVEELNQLDPADQRPGAPVFLAGNIRATLTSRVARQLTMTVPSYLFPFDANALLNPYGDQLRCFRGLRYGDGSVDEFPTFVGPVTSVTAGGGNTATVNAADLAGEVVAAGFAAPSLAQAGDNVVDEFERLVSDALPTATFGTHTPGIFEKVPALTYDGDRGTALDGLAKVAGAFWYTLAGGAFVFRRVPWTIPLTSQPLVIGTGGADMTNLGSVTEAYPTRSRDGIYNRVTVTGETLDGSAPVVATVDDLDPTSPTFIGGPFGIKGITVRVTQATNQGVAFGAATTILARSKARTESWRVSLAADGSIELGDPLRLLYRGRDVLQLVAGYVMPLEAAGQMTIDGRDLVSTEVEE